MRLQIPLTFAFLLTCIALACGPKSAESDTQASDGSTGPASTSPGTTTEPTTGPVVTGSPDATDTDASSTTGPVATDTENGTSTTGPEPHPADACALVPDPGECEAAFDRYFFNPQTQQCEVFTWGGCGGVVPFDDFMACQVACDPCELFFDTQPSQSQFPPVEIAVRNDTAAPIFLRNWAPGGIDWRHEPFTVWPEDGPQLHTGPGCEGWCYGIENYECGTLCTESGPQPPAIMIIPGGVFHTQWGGQHSDLAELPAACTPNVCEPGIACGRWFDATPGPYQIRVAGKTESDCQPDCCTPNLDGWCETVSDNDYDFDLYPLELAVPFTFPGGPVELAFQ